MIASGIGDGECFDKLKHGCAKLLRRYRWDGFAQQSTIASVSCRLHEAEHH